MWYICCISDIFFHRVLSVLNNDPGVWVPTYSEFKFHRGKIKRVEKAVLPGYAFLDTLELFDCLKGVYPTVYLLKSVDEYPYTLAGAEIQAVEERLKEMMKAKPKYCKDDKVIITDGLFSGYDGVVQRVDGNLLVVKSELFNMKIPLYIDYSQVKVKKK